MAAQFQSLDGLILRRIVHRSAVAISAEWNGSDFLWRHGGRSRMYSVTDAPVVVVSAVARRIITSRGAFDRRGVAPRVYGRQPPEPRDPAGRRVQ